MVGNTGLLPLITLIFVNYINKYVDNYINNCLFTYFFTYCLLDPNKLTSETFLVSGGSPYPRMDGRKIASLLQGGYRMPKPQHVDDEL